MQEAPAFNDHQGEREAMLTSFCQFQGINCASGKRRSVVIIEIPQGPLNPGDDSDPNHWDIALLVSGVDFYGSDGRGGRSYTTMGLATVTGICSKSYGCVIGEMGVSWWNLQ